MSEPTNDAFRDATARQRGLNLDGSVRRETVEQFYQCDDCPPEGYPTDGTRCSKCPRRTAPPAPPREDATVGGSVDAVEAMREQCAAFAFAQSRDWLLAQGVRALQPPPRDGGQATGAEPDGAALADPREVGITVGQQRDRWRAMALQYHETGLRFRVERNNALSDLATLRTSAPPAQPSEAQVVECIKAEIGVWPASSQARRALEDVLRRVRQAATVAPPTQPSEAQVEAALQAWDKEAREYWPGEGRDGRPAGERKSCMRAALQAATVAPSRETEPRPIEVAPYTIHHDGKWVILHLRGGGVETTNSLTHEQASDLSEQLTQFACAACGNEERGQGGYLSCECPAPGEPRPVDACPTCGQFSASRAFSHALSHPRKPTEEELAECQAALDRQAATAPGEPHPVEERVKTQIDAIIEAVMETCSIVGDGEFEENFRRDLEGLVAVAARPVEQTGSGDAEIDDLPIERERAAVGRIMDRLYGEKDKAEADLARVTAENERLTRERDAYRSEANSTQAHVDAFKHDLVLAEKRVTELEAAVAGSKIDDFLRAKLQEAADHGAAVIHVNSQDCVEILAAAAGSDVAGLRALLGGEKCTNCEGKGEFYDTTYDRTGALVKCGKCGGSGQYVSSYKVAEARAALAASPDAGAGRTRGGMEDA